MSKPYDDMLDLPHHVSSGHPQMSMEERAAQFSPFAALTGHSTAISETARLTDRKVELSEDTKALLDQKQRILSEHIKERPELVVTWFQPDTRKEGGKYLTTAGKLKKIDEFERVLILTDGTRIPLEGVTDLKSAFL